MEEFQAQRVDNNEIIQIIYMIQHVVANLCQFELNLNEFWEFAMTFRIYLKYIKAHARVEFIDFYNL